MMADISSKQCGEGSWEGIILEKYLQDEEDS